MNIKLIRWLDRHIGSFLCYFLGFFLHYPNLGEDRYKKIAVIQLWGIGETILTLPAIRALRLKYKDRKIDLICTSRNQDVYIKNKDINNIRTVKLGPFSIFSFIIANYNHYDLVIDMEEYLKISAIISFFIGREHIGFSHGIRARLYNRTVEYDDKKHAMDAFLDLAREANADYDTEKLIGLETTGPERKKVKEFLKKNKNKRLLIGITPGAAESARSRMWPKENYAKLSDSLIERYDCQIIFIGSADEKQLIDSIISDMDNKAINTAGMFQLREVFYLIKNFSLFISNDTGPMHIAAAQGIKTIGLFGPNLPERFGPYGPGNIPLYKGTICPDSPCINVHLGKIPECDDPRCMAEIKIKDVLDAAKKILGS